MDDNGQNQVRRRSHRKLWIALAVVVVLVIASGVYLVVSGKSVEERLAALRAAGYPTSFAELAEYNKLPDGAENAAGTYEEALNSFVPPSDVNVPLFAGATLPDRGQPLPEATAQAMSKCLEDNEKCLGLLRQAGGIEHCRYTWDYAAGIPTSLSEVKNCARLLHLAAVFHANEGDGGTAVGFIKDGLRLADSLEGEPLLVSHLVRVACIGVSWSALEQVLNTTSLTDDQLKDLRDSLARTAESIDLAKVMVTERCYMIECFYDPSMLSGPGGGGKTLMNIPIIGKRGLLDTLDFMEDCVEAARLEGIERLARSREIEKEIEDLSFFHVVVKMLAPAMSRVGVIDARVETHLSLSQGAIAIERYRLAKGELPEKLEELVPEYLEAVPIDAFDDKPIKYRRTEPGYVLWGVDEDGEDNGGVERDRKKKDQPYDLTFIVTR